MAWAKNGTPKTLSSAGDTITISDLTSKKFNVLLSHLFTSGYALGYFRFDNISTNSYASRFCDNGGSDTTLTSQSDVVWRWGTSNETFFGVGYCINISGEEKLVICFLFSSQSAGAGNAPARREVVGKYTGTSQFTRVDIVNTDTGDYATDSNLSVLGTD